jgi:hypothetical protein
MYNQIQRRDSREGSAALLCRDYPGRDGGSMLDPIWVKMNGPCGTRIKKIYEAAKKIRRYVSA